MHVLLCCFFFHLLITYGSGYEFSDRADGTNSKVFPFVGGNSAVQQKRDDHFNALNDFEGSYLYGLHSPYKNALFEDDEIQFPDHRKKSDSRPKYDPGWKFIGLGKRPEEDEDLEYTPELGKEGGVNPLLGISTLINFEFFNAIKDGMEDGDREALKKELWANTPIRAPEGHSGSLRYNNKLNLYTGRQKYMYDPAWMLTGLGK